MGRGVAIFISAVGVLSLIIGLFIINDDKTAGIVLIAVGIGQTLMGFYLFDLIDILEKQVRRSYHNTAFLKVIAYSLAEKPSTLRNILDQNSSILTETEIGILEDCFSELSDPEAKE